MSDSQMPDALEIRQDYNAIRANIVINDETKLEHHKIKNYETKIFEHHTSAEFARSRNVEQLTLDT